MPQPPHPPPSKFKQGDASSATGIAATSHAMSGASETQPVTKLSSPDLSNSLAALAQTASSPDLVRDSASSDPSLSKARHDPHLGQVFGGKYVIDRVLGEGGMGIVYLAKHKAIGKKFAIKLLHAEATKDPEVVERFKVEAQAASSIGNEHIIDITDFAELPDGSTYFVMEMLDGKPLSKLFEELKRVPTPRLTRIAKQLTQGLGAAHAAGIVHRDLKPDNIYLCKRSGGEVDFIKILDFGIAKVGQGASKLTKAGAIFGTPHYMSPEQASGSPVDQRTDIYALGVMLYEAAVGRVPFDADNFMGILTQHMYKTPVAPRAVPECPADLSPGLEVIIMRCLRKKAEERYQTMEELEEDLDRLARGEVPKAAQDMMALSAGYQSLARSALDAASMPKPIPGEPSFGSTTKRASWPIYVGVSAVVGVIAMAVAVMNKGPSSAAKAEPSTAQSSDLTKAREVEKPAPIVMAEPSASAARKTRIVLLTGPAGAKFYDGDTLVGDEPFNYELEVGASKTLVVKAEGYLDKSITLEAKTPSRLNTTLTKQPNKPFAPSQPGAKKGSSSSSDSDDPWAKK
ncbi:MAG: hypothetical protein NVSMB1_08550 [Polyangiales bacterium]